MRFWTLELIRESVKTFGTVECTYFAYEKDKTIGGVKGRTSWTECLCPTENSVEALTLNVMVFGNRASERE